jgi:hypothetical protein
LALRAQPFFAVFFRAAAIFISLDFSNIFGLCWRLSNTSSIGVTEEGIVPWPSDEKKLSGKEKNHD